MPLRAALARAWYARFASTHNRLPPLPCFHRPATQDSDRPIGTHPQPVNSSATMIAVAYLVVLGAFPSTRYRLYGSNLTDAPLWTVHSLRLLASPTCDPSTRLSSWASVASSGEYCTNSMFCGSLSLMYGPDQPLQPSHTPSMFMLNPWSGTATNGDMPWIEVNFTTPTTIGCVQLFQSPRAMARSLWLIAMPIGGRHFVEVARGDAGACPGDSSCCRTSPDAGWDCPQGVSSLSAGPLPPGLPPPPESPPSPSPPKTPPPPPTSPPPTPPPTLSSPSPEPAPPPPPSPTLPQPTPPPPSPMTQSPPPLPPVAVGNGQHCGPAHGHARCSCETGLSYCHEVAGLCGASAAFAMADPSIAYDCAPPAPPAPPTGCMSPDALNYYSTAQVDDGSCIIGGCTDATSTGFNPQATYEDGSCPPIILGCTNSAASNYRHLANADDASCRYAGCMFSTANNYDPNAQIPGACDSVGPHGCTDPAAINYYPDAQQDDGSCVIAGCTDPSRSNYNPRASFNDGMCAPVFPGCTNPSRPNYHVRYTVDDGSCSVPGCMDSATSNYNAAATHDDGTCTLTQPQPQPEGRRLSATPLSGCMDPQSDTYSALATLHAPEACRYPLLGCTDATAHNFLAGANRTRSPSECHYLMRGCTVAGAVDFDSNANALSSCTFNFRGCTSSSAANFAPYANLNDGTCLPATVLGCADALAENYDSRATVSTGCTYQRVGCADSSAHTFASDTTIHDPSACTYAVLGCMLPMASNYVPEATRDDASCSLLSLPSPPPLPRSSPWPPALWWPAPPSLPPSQHSPPSPPPDLAALDEMSQQLSDDADGAIPAWALAVVIASVAMILTGCVAVFFWCDHRLRKRASESYQDATLDAGTKPTRHRQWYANWRSAPKSDVQGVVEAQMGTVNIEIAPAAAAPSPSPALESPLSLQLQRSGSSDAGPIEQPPVPTGSEEVADAPVAMEGVNLYEVPLDKVDAPVAACSADSDATCEAAAAPLPEPAPSLPAQSPDPQQSDAESARSQQAGELEEEERAPTPSVPAAFV